MLSVFEKLVGAGWVLRADAFSIYIAISGRERLSSAVVEADLFRCISRHTFREPNVTLAQRAAVAANAKQVAVRTLFASMLTASRQARPWHQR